MNKVKLLSLIVIGLFLSNVLLIGFIAFNRMRHPRPEGPRNSIIEKLKLDESQITEYDKLIQTHRTEIHKSEDEIIEVKNKLYSTLTQDPGINSKDSLIAELGGLQQKIENAHYRHFEELKKICKENQKPAFENLAKELAALFASHRPEKK